MPWHPFDAPLPAAAWAPPPIEASAEPPHDPARYGDLFAAHYDLLYPRLDRLLLQRLAQLAQGGAVLELGAGTGRAVQPLLALGLQVWALEASSKMLQRLRERCGEPGPPCIQADMACFVLPQRFALVTLLVDTLDLLPAPRQAAVFRCAAAHLAANGVLLVERFGSPSESDEEIRIRLDGSAGSAELGQQICSASDQQHLQWAQAAGLRRRALLPGPGGARHLLYQRACDIAGSGSSEAAAFAASTPRPTERAHGLVQENADGQI